jgi:methionine-rich copper-binding protein CopC
MRKRLQATFVSVAIISSLVAATPVDVPHLELSRSVPEAGSSVQSPSEVRLWFNEVPEAGTVQIRLVEAADAGVHVEDAAQDTEDATVFSIMMHGTLAPGTYTVSWRAMSDDGEVARETFEFNVVAP